ncbi:MAG TPA: SxtJ family membrane protein [Candidatus Binatus sp.]|uniref:SxtJ family membrane protein n=1 Tax=Candidatus Binatus sp. TaxID=2811406 RepID=UPI002F405AD4
MKISNDFNFPERIEHGDDLRRSSDRVFGLAFSVFWSVVALAPVIKGGPIRVWAVTLAAVFLVFGLVRPTVLGPLNQLWQRFGRLLQRLSSPIVMAILFCSTVVPFGLIMRLLNRDALRLKWERGSVTYWIPRNPPGPRPESMKDQF